MLGVAGVFDVPRALPRCKDTSEIVPLLQCFRLERVAFLHLLRSLISPSCCDPLVEKIMIVMFVTYTV